MAQRLVTLQDLEKHPELVSKGVSLNQLYDFGALEATPTESNSVAANEESQETTKPPTKKKATKITHKATPVKQKAKRK